jgi:tetrahydromethanopterin S-methyltransferase subunit G
MATEVTRDEFDHFKTRVDIVEREVEGEKIVTRHILEQTRRNGDDLAAVKSRLDRHDQRFDVVEREIRGLRNEIRGLRDELPTIVGDVVREALRERDR